MFDNFFLSTTELQWIQLLVGLCPWDSEIHKHLQLKIWLDSWLIWSGDRHNGDRRVLLIQHNIGYMFHHTIWQLPEITCFIYLFRLSAQSS